MGSRKSLNAGRFSSLWETVDKAKTAAIADDEGCAVARGYVDGQLVDTGSPKFKKFASAFFSCHLSTTRWLSLLSILQKVSYHSVITITKIIFQNQKYYIDKVHIILRLLSKLLLCIIFWPYVSMFT